MTQPGALNELHRKWVSPEQPNPEICREKQAWASGNNWDGNKKRKEKKKRGKKGALLGNIYAKLKETVYIADN